MDQSCAVQIDQMSGAEAKVFLRQLLDGEAMRSPEVNQHIRKMLRGQRDQVAWFKERMAPGADAECLPMIVKSKKKVVMCVKCGQTPKQSGHKHKGCCGKCSPAFKKMCAKCGQTPRQGGTKHEGCCAKCSPAAF